MGETDVKKCPKCGSDMEKGFLISARSFFWSAEPHDNILAYSPWHVFTKGVEIIAKESFTSIANVPAYRCRKCKLVLFDYGSPQQT